MKKQNFTQGTKKLVFDSKENSITAHNNRAAAQARAEAKRVRKPKNDEWA